MVPLNSLSFGEPQWVSFEGRCRRAEEERIYMKEGGLRVLSVGGLSREIGNIESQGTNGDV